MDVARTMYRKCTGQLEIILQPQPKSYILAITKLFGDKFFYFYSGMFFKKVFMVSVQSQYICTNCTAVMGMYGYGSCVRQFGIIYHVARMCMAMTMYGAC